MNIVKRIESREQCTEAGWYAYDYMLDSPMNPDIISRLAEFGGDFVYLKGLKMPFYKLENTFYVIKGLQDKAELRLAVYRDQESEVLERFEKFLISICQNDKSVRSAVGE